jgi:hypothetical protein
VKRLILAVVCVAAAVVPALAQAQAQQQTKPGALASLIQAGNRKAALDMIRAGADVIRSPTAPARYTGRSTLWTMSCSRR